MIRNGKHNAFSAAIWVKILFRIRLQLPLVTEVDQELLTVERIANKALSAVFRDKPINDTKTQWRFAIEIRQNFIDFRLVGIETLETGNDQFWFTFNLAFSGLRIGGIAVHVCSIHRPLLLGPCRCLCAKSYFKTPFRIEWPHRLTIIPLH